MVTNPSNSKSELTDEELIEDIWNEWDDAGKRDLIEAIADRMGQEKFCDLLILEFGEEEIIKCLERMRMH